MDDEVFTLLKDASQGLCQLAVNQPADECLLRRVIERVEALVRCTSSFRAVSHLSHSSLAVVDCISAVVGVLTDPSCVKKLLLPSIDLLTNLASSHDICNILQGALQVASLITGRLKDASDIKLQFACLRALQATTYNAAYTAGDAFVEQLVHLIIPHILGPMTDLTVPSLAILANVTRRSAFAQTYVKSLPNVRTLLRTLISCLSHTDVSVIVCSLAPLTNLCLHEDLGAKLFNSKNIHQSFQLIFSLLTDDTGPVVIRYAVDLFSDLLSAPSIAHALQEYSSLKESLASVVARLEKGPSDVTRKLLELLCNLFSMQGLRSVHQLLCQLILGSGAGAGMPPSEQNLFLVVLQCGAKADHHTALLAWRLVAHIFEACSESASMPAFSSQASTLMRAAILPLNKLGHMQWVNTDSLVLHQCCTLAATVLELLVRFVQVSQFASAICQSVTPELCRQLIEQQLANNPMIGSGNASLTAQPSCVSGMEVALLTLQLMTKLSDFSTEFEVPFQRVLQDPRLFPCIATALRSDRRAFVSQGLSIFGAFCREANQGDCSRLADIMAELNGLSTQQEATSCTNAVGAGTGSGFSRTFSSSAFGAGAPPIQLATAGMATPHSAQTSVMFQPSRHCVASAQPPPHTVTSLASPPAVSQTPSADVQALIERMQGGLNLKDIRAHEIMEIYEHELASRSTKENHLQDLLEAKTAALAQADRLIAQYRCRHAQSELECAKLRALLQECEKRSVKQQMELEAHSVSRLALQEENSALREDQQQLYRLTQDYSQLTSQFDEHKHRLEVTLRNLAAAQEEQTALSELLELQGKHSEKLKAQLEGSNRQLEMSERQYQQTHQQLTAKEVQCSELHHSLQRCEKMLTDQQQDFEQLQRDCQAVKCDLSATVDVKHRQTRQIASLEEDMERKTRSLEKAEGELEKLQKLRTMIHNLSGGINSQSGAQAL